MHRLAWIALLALVACDRKPERDPTVQPIADPIANPIPRANDPVATDDDLAPSPPPTDPSANAPANAPPANALPANALPANAPPADPPPAQPSGSDGPQFDLRPIRQIDALAGIYPSQDGDLLVGKGCNFLYKTTPYEAGFVFCNDELVAGPLTTAEQIREVYAQINQANKSAFEIGRAIRARMPTGCANCRYRYYDQNGNLVRESR